MTTTTKTSAKKKASKQAKPSRALKIIDSKAAAAAKASTKLTEQTMSSVSFMTVIKIDPRELDPSPFQPRRDAMDLSELVASIKEVGLLHMPIVRDGLGDRKEIVIGHRRVAACVELGFEEIEVRYLAACSEEDVRIIQAAENAVRKDLHPLDEAQAYSELLDLLGSVEVVSENVGVSVQNVKKRLALLSLSQEWRDYWRAENAVTLGAAQAVAALGSEDQAAVFSDHVTPAMDEIWGLTRDLRQAPGPKITELLVRDWCRRKDEELRHAPFDVEDASLPGGACSACPKRASTQRDLFGALDHDRCLDRTCWRQKIQVVNTRMLEQLGLEAPLSVPNNERWHWRRLDNAEDRTKLAELEEQSGIKAERKAIQFPDQEEYSEAVSLADYQRIKEAAAKPAANPEGAATASDGGKVHYPRPLRTTVQRNYSWVLPAIANKESGPTLRDILLTTIAIMIVQYGEADLDGLNLRERFEEVLAAEDSGIDGREVMRLQFADFLEVNHQDFLYEDDAKLVDRLLAHLSLEAPAVPAAAEQDEEPSDADD